MKKEIGPSERVAIQGNSNKVKIVLSGDGDLENISWLMMDKVGGGIWELKNIRSTSSYGHFLIKLALEVIDSFGDKGLMIDRELISDDGKRFWKSFEDGRLGIGWKELPGDFKKYEGGESYLDYYLLGGDFGELQKLIRDGKLYSEDFDFGQGGIKD